MQLNLDVFGNIVGLAKAVTVIVGLLDLIIVAACLVRVGEEEVFLACVIICWIISFLWLLLTVLGVLTPNDLTIKIDMVFHICAFIFFIVSIICYIVAISRYDHKRVARVFGLLFGIANSSIYGFIGFKIFKNADTVVTQ